MSLLRGGGIRKALAVNTVLFCTGRDVVHGGRNLFILAANIVCWPQTFAFCLPMHALCRNAPTHHVFPVI